MTAEAPTLPVREFGKELLRLNDLDPVYVLVWEAMNTPGSGFDRRKVYHWLLAYWSFYHVGTASWVTDPLVYLPDGRLPKEWDRVSGEYWERMGTAAGSKDYPRSSERRHFRGENAKESVAFLLSMGVPRLFHPFFQDQTNGVTARAEHVMAEVLAWTGFGPWIAFKAADMLERLGLMKIDFEPTSQIFYKSPREAALLLWDECNPGLDPEREPGDVVAWAIGEVLAGLKRDPIADRGTRRGLAPPRYERELNAQEAETILCKWGSYRKGHYHIGEDVKACREGLKRFARSRTAQTLLKAGAKGGLW